MPCASGRSHFGADSQIMELPDCLSAHADPGLELPAIYSGNFARLFAIA